eukprot:jgi/Chrzof1/7849/Cz02g38230.t1
MTSRAFVFVLILLCGAGFAVALGGNRALLGPLLLAKKAAIAKKAFVLQKAAPAAAPAPAPTPAPAPAAAPAAVTRCFGFKKFSKCFSVVKG